MREGSKLKILMNRKEAETHDCLRAACDRWGAFVFAKVRLADVLKIGNSGITGSEFEFALRSHLDFVVTDVRHHPLFAVEFDGPSHRSAIQKSRDNMKNRLCEQFQLSLLRINAHYLEKRYGQMDLLTWFVQVYFLAEGFDEAQLAGAIPADEVFDPASFVFLPDMKGAFPLWLSRKVLVDIQRLADEGKIYDFVPSYYIGEDAAEAYHAIGWLLIDRDHGVYAKTGMKSQFFPGANSEIVCEILIHEVYEKLIDVLNGSSKPMPVKQLDALLRRHQNTFRLVSAGGLSRS